MSLAKLMNVSFNKQVSNVRNVTNRNGAYFLFSIEFIFLFKIFVPARRDVAKTIFISILISYNFLHGFNSDAILLSSSSTINPILYNVMSHRYRIAFRETLCSRKRGFYSSANGFARDQSSFRETTIAPANRDHNLNYEGSQLVT